MTFGGICDRYIAEELPERYSTAKSYLSNINLHIKPRWGEYLIGAIRPMAVEGWLKEMDKSPKTKAHIRSVMHVIFECAARWELFNERRNPIEMVRVKDSTKRRKRPMILTNESFDAVLAVCRTVAHDGAGGAMPGTSRKRDRGIAVGRPRYRPTSASRSTKHRERQSGRRQDRILPRSCASDPLMRSFAGGAAATEEGWCQSANKRLLSTEIQKRIFASGCCV